MKSCFFERDVVEMLNTIINIWALDILENVAERLCETSGQVVLMNLFVHKNSPQ